jgi:phage/plasmid-like protein (TIGR03299 family)
VAHELERLANGQTAFVTARQTAWHQLGTVTTDCMTADEVISTAWLAAWNVRKIPVFGQEITDDGVTLIDAPDKRMTVRTNPVTHVTEYLGIVGDDYAPVQNEECAELLDLLIDESGAHFETAGSMRGGRRIFVTMKMPQGIRIAGVDNLDLYLAVTTSHDGTTALRVDATPIRIVCANTQRLALHRSVGHYCFRHTSSIKGRIAQARQAVGITFAYAEAFQAEAERMINQELDMANFRKVCTEIWPAPEPGATVRTINNHTRRTQHLDRLFTLADTQANIRGTAWAGYQAIVEYLDHFSPAGSDQRRAERVLTSTTLAAVKQRAHDLLMPA